MPIIFCYFFIFGTEESFGRFLHINFSTKHFTCAIHLLLNRSKEFQEMSLVIVYCCAMINVHSIIYH